MKYSKFMLYGVCITLLLQISCVENTFIFEVNPNGDFNFQYQGKGDQPDLDNADFPIPRGAGWTITTEHDSINKIWVYTAAKGFQNSDEFPDNFFTSDTVYPPSLIHHPLKVDHYNWFFKEVYRFTWSFLNRGINQKYPGMANVLHEGMENPGWTSEVLEYLLTDCLHRANVGYNREPIIKAELDRWFSASLKDLPDSLIAKNYDSLKTAGLTLLKQSIDQLQYTVIDSIFKQLEDESLVTLDMIDDQFILKLLLPGKVTESNADTTLTDTLFWEFDVNRFHSTDFHMTATSQIIYPSRYKWAMGSMVFVIVVVITGMWKWRAD